MNREAMEIREVSPGYALKAAKPAVPEGYKQTKVGAIPEDWECEKLEAFLSFISYGFTNPMPTVESGIYMVTAADIGDGRIQLDTARMTSLQAYKNLLTDKSRPRKNDILLTKDGTLGRLAVVGEETICINQSVAVIRTNRKADPLFIKFLLEGNSYQKRMIEDAGGSTIKHIYITIVDKMPIGLPSDVSEQRAIATALSDVDALLEELDRLIAKKRDIKQATMQQLLTGQTRLPGFEQEWETKRIGELLTICHGRNQHEVEVKDGQFPILATSGVIGTSKHALYNRPSVLIGRKGTINKPRYMATPFWSVDTLFYSVIEEDNDAKYLYYQFLMIDWLQYNEASGVPSLSARTIENIEINCPQPLEQRAISSVLSDLDTEIQFLEQSRTKTAAIKQAMMQDLLTGRIRLIETEAVAEAGV